MTNLIVIADIGDFVFVAILVIASIAGQIAKASKRQRPGGAPPSTPPAQPKTTPSPFGSADDQLRNFLETLATGQPPADRPNTVTRQEPPVQTPPQQRPQPAPVAKQNQGSRQQVSEFKRPARQQMSGIKQAAAPAAARTVVQPAQAVRTPVPSQVPPPRTPKRRITKEKPSIARALAGGEQLREAIVLREILGPPLSLRETSSGGDK